MTNGSHSVKNASKIRSHKKKAAAQCSHVQALMCFSRLSAVQCFLHSLHCTSRLTSGNHSLPPSWLESPITTVRSKQTSHQKLCTSAFSQEIWGAQKSRSFWRLPLRALLLMALQGRFHSLMAWSQMAQRAGTVLWTFPPKKKGIPRSPMPNTFGSTNSMTWCFLLFFWIIFFPATLKAHVLKTTPVTSGPLGAIFYLVPTRIYLAHYAECLRANSLLVNQHGHGGFGGGGFHELLLSCSKGILDFEFVCAMWFFSASNGFLTRSRHLLTQYNMVHFTSQQNLLMSEEKLRVLSQLTNVHKLLQQHSCAFYWSD